MFVTILIELHKGTTIFANNQFFNQLIFIRLTLTIFVVHESPVYKFADTWEGVGHRHKLTKLVEERYKLKVGIRDLQVTDKTVVWQGQNNIVFIFQGF